ncbi:hypothetical protein D3C84_431410 [compost metagenome]
MSKSVEKIREISAVVQQSGIRRWRLPGIDRSSGLKPLCPDQTLDGGKVREQCVRGSFQDSIAVHQKTGLFD